MAPQTRSSTRTDRVTTRSSVARAQPLQKADVPKNAPKPSRKPKTKPSSKPRPKLKVEPKVEQESEPARKRIRHSGMKGRPSDNGPATILLMNLPVEVLIEVARYIHPLDLIMLSRVNKFFRELFMDKRSALVWRSARENLPGLPACPSETSEPQYAAMLFAKRCSTCGGYAPREMNPVLMIRLCSHCWEEELVSAHRVTDASLLSVINAPVPGQSRTWKSWCLYKEARAVKIKLNELTEAGDEEALRQWKEERYELVQTRRKNAEPLEKWLVKRERERARDRHELRASNKKEIESRLIELGWEKGDFVCYDRWRRKEWNSAITTMKAITDKVWDNLLPRLLGHLEINRNDRLQREQSQRQAARRNAVYNWLETTRSLLPFYARATPAGESPSDAGHTPSASTSWGMPDSDSPQVLRQTFPASSQVHEWPEYKTLIDNDVPHEQFLIDFEEKKPEFQQSIVEWRRELDAHLVMTLSDDVRPPNYDQSFTMTVRVGENVQPISALPEDTQKLLRADSIFTISPPNDPYVFFYPHGFDRLVSDITKVVCHSKAREIAQAFLRDLGIPDASYLGLKALGRAFRCGRCPQAVVDAHDWRGIIIHYMEHQRSWKAVTRQRQVRSKKNFIYVCTHDINMEDADRPLVRMSTQEPIPTTPAWSYSQCLLCQSVSIYSGVHSLAIVDHLRYVHLVEEPEMGTHYT
ncbi:unnamed protein product [Rhizoctonia solani]|uniref:F-box domain-containing protein n=1 Tax=Rhizoctonia solani TaxID=456999 RepID=A0A8H3ARF7_9AGAM|nr:unnamed protein product [Rhizoctonia solani]